MKTKKPIKIKLSKVTIVPGLEKMHIRGPGFQEKMDRVNYILKKFPPPKIWPA